MLVTPYKAVRVLSVGAAALAGVCVGALFQNTTSISADAVYAAAGIVGYLASATLEFALFILGEHYLQCRRTRRAIRRRLDRVTQARRPQSDDGSQ